MAKTDRPPLSDEVIRGAVARQKIWRLYDSLGLIVEIHPSGGKYWRVKYRFGGKEKRLALGVFPDVTASDARRLRDEARLALYGSSTEPGTRLAARSGHPEHYETGERFDPSFYDWLSPDRVRWHYLGEAFQLSPQRADFLAHLVGAGIVREISASPAKLQCTGARPCPETGIWEGRVAVDHAAAVLYNRWDQQAFVEQGESFPSLGNRFIDIASEDVQWKYLGSPNAETGMPGIRVIDL